MRDIFPPERSANRSQSERTGRQADESATVQVAARQRHPWPAFDVVVESPTWPPTATRTLRGLAGYLYVHGHQTAEEMGLGFEIERVVLDGVLEAGGEPVRGPPNRVSRVSGADASDPDRRRSGPDGGGESAATDGGVRPTLRRVDLTFYLRRTGPEAGDKRLKSWTDTLRATVGNSSYTPPFGDVSVQWV